MEPFTNAKLATVLAGALLLIAGIYFFRDLDIRRAPIEAISSRYVAQNLFDTVCQYRRACGHIPSSSAVMYGNICSECRLDEQCGFRVSQLDPAQLNHDGREITFEATDSQITVAVFQLRDGAKVQMEKLTRSFTECARN